MNTVLAFDVYGTLIDTAGVVIKLRELVGARAADFSRVWRDKQLEYSFRRGLMQRYENFAVCTRDALDYTCACFKVMLTQEEREALLGAYGKLPAFADVAEGLAGLRGRDFAVYAFSNGAANAVEGLLQTAGIRDHFRGVVSVDEVGSFKPDPAVYRHFLQRSGADGPSAWLISSNPFDVIGAVAAGMQAAWVKRSAGALFDPWGIEPTITVAGLRNIGDRIADFEAGRLSS
jgi:2-haloacid dehalogenase